MLDDDLKRWLHHPHWRPKILNRMLEHREETEEEAWKAVFEAHRLQKIEELTEKVSAASLETPKEEVFQVGKITYQYIGNGIYTSCSIQNYTLLEDIVKATKGWKDAHLFAEWQGYDSGASLRFAGYRPLTTKEKKERNRLRQRFLEEALRALEFAEDPNETIHTYLSYKSK